MHLEGHLDQRVWHELKGAFATSMHIPEFRLGGVHARIGSLRSLRSSSISVQQTAKPPRMFREPMKDE